MLYKEIIEENNDEIEATIISCILNNHAETEDIFLELDPNDFKNPNNMKIFLVCKKLKTEGKQHSYLDVLDFFNQNKTNKEFFFTNFQEYIENINNLYTFEATVTNLIDISKKNSLVNKIQKFGSKLLGIEMDVINYSDRIYEIQTEFLEILNSKKNNEVKALSELLPEYQIRLEKISNHSDQLTGCPSGYEEIDKITNGFQPGDMIILAARPGVGKTAISINFMLNAAKELYQENLATPNEKPKGILMFSMEMGNSQICERLVAVESCVDINTTKRGTSTKVESFSVSEAITRLSEYPILIDDSNNLSIIDVQSKIKQASLKYDLKLVIIDYLQLLRGPEIRGMQHNRQQEVSNISRIIKQVARQYEVPIIAIAQLSRKIEERKGDQRKPILSDLRESGSIEQDADIVSFLSYKEENEENISKNTNESVVEYIIAKHRNGETGQVELLFKKSIGKYLTLRKKYEKSKF